MLKKQISILITDVYMFRSKPDHFQKRNRENKLLFTCLQTETHPIDVVAKDGFVAPIYLLYEKAAYRFMVKRTFEVCTPNYLEKELSFKCNIASKNSYSHSFIKIIINKFESKSPP